MAWSLFVFTVVSLFTVALSVCPAGWAQMGRTCYYIFGDKLNRSEAFTLCNDHSAGLVSFSNSGDWNYVSRLVSSVQLDAGAWTDLFFDNGKWTWSKTSEPYTELNQWKVSLDDPTSGGTTPQPGQNYVPSPDPQHSWAKIYFDNSDTSLYVADGASLLHPFCQRDIDARDLCDSNEDWHKLVHGCYKSYMPASWSDAVSTCSIGGGELMQASSSTELEPISILTGLNTDVWMGVSYEAGGDYYQPDQKTKVTYLPWLTPSSKFRYANETCVAARHTNSTPGYFTKACDMELPFICRRPVGICPLGWYQDGIECFKLHIRPQERMSWFMAVDYCKSLHGHMVEKITTTQAAKMLNQALQENEVDFAWIGFSGITSEYHYLSDMNSVAVVETFIQYNTTTFKEGPYRCGVTDFSPDRSVYPVVYCFVPRPFVCSIALTDSLVTPSKDTLLCKDGWLPFQGVCYKIVTQPMSHSDAATNCTGSGGSLALINSTTDQSLFSTQNFTDMSLESFWIGVTSAEDGSLWILPSLGEEAPFWNFDPHQLYPETADTCVYVRTGSIATYLGSWFYDDCNSKHPFICEMPGTYITPRQTYSRYRWSARCGVGWILHNSTNLCYFISPYIHKPWREARQDCHTMEGDLLSLYGQDEQDFVESILKSDQFSSLEEPLWMGAGDMYTNYGWGWSDEKPFKYIHWAEGQPQYSSDDGDNCGYIPVSKNFEWEARPCSEKLGFICKKEALPASTTGAATPPPEGSCVPGPRISGDYSIQFPSGFSASSFKDEEHRPERSRMLAENNASWSPATDSTDEWLAVTFASVIDLTELQIKGEDSTDQYVTKFELQYQYDDLSPWYWVTNGNKKKVYEGIDTPDGFSTLFLPGGVQATSVKIWPVEWHKHISVVWELVGCDNDQCTPELSVSGPLIVDDRHFSASSEQQGFDAWNARVQPASNNNQDLKWWAPSPGDAKPWIQVDLDKIRVVHGIRLQGGLRSNHVTKFQLMFSQNEGTDPYGFITYSEPYGHPKTFDGVGHDNLPVDVWLVSAVRARTVRIMVLEWNNEAQVVFDVYTCPVGCSPEPQIVNLPRSSLTASDFEDGHEPSRSVLNTVQEGDLADSWQPHQFLGDSSYIQVDLGTVKQVTAVATQGSESEDAWVTSYYLAFSTDGKYFWQHGGNKTYYSVESDFTIYEDRVIYSGNFNGYSVVKNEIITPVNARYVQLWPNGFHGPMAVRWEVYACERHTADIPIGCFADDPSDPDLPYEPLEDKFASVWPEACLSHCYLKGYHFAGLQNGKTCSCGNEYGMYGQGTNCSIPCQDPYSNFTCGGQNQNIIYSTGLSSVNMVCTSGWTAYGDSCYASFVEDTWSNARSTCRRLRADLVDISDEGENDFVVGLIEDSGLSSNAWIGFNDFKDTLNFEWTSESEITYTNWGYRQPIVNPGLDQHSVIISNDGTWSNVLSDNINTVICEAPKKPSSKPVSQIQDEGCLPGWRALGRKCYTFNRQKNDWDTAKTICQSNNSQLAHIDSRLENQRLTSALRVLTDSYWIDVRDPSSTGLYVHGSGVTDLHYTNWYSEKPDAVGQCVYINTAHQAGKWTNHDCSNKHRFICEMPRTSVTPPRTPSTTQTPSSCQTGWDLHGSLCYKFNVKEQNQMLSWHEASEHCKEQGATLASIHSVSDFDAISNQVKSINKGSFWFGLNNLDASTGFEWSDGSVMNFIRWTNGEPRAYDPRAVCGELLVDSHDMGLQWCSQLKNWVCSIEPGKPVQVPANVTFPKPEPMGSCAPLSDAWHKYGNYCYYISNGQSGAEGDMTWREAQQYCETHGADLASINSDDENRFLQGMLNSDFLLPVEGVWIGLNELDRDGGYRWSDGSPVGLWVLNWNVNEPNDYDGLEACVEFLARNGKWNDKHCGLRSGFVCKQPAPGVNITKPAAAIKPQGNCPTNFLKYGHKCFRIMGEVGSHLKLSWEDARTSCRNTIIPNYHDYQVDFASITSVEENAFVMTMMSEHRERVWIGLKRRGGQLLWSDNEDLSYENWNIDEPNMGPGNDSCVYMFGQAEYAGKWNDVACEEKAAYVCQGFVDSSFPPVHTPPSPLCNADASYEQMGSSSCIKLNDNPQAWEGGQNQCVQFGGNLATISDYYDWARLFLMIRSGCYECNDGVWIGFNDRSQAGSYNWVDDAHVTFTRWAHHQPLDQDGWGCVYMDQNGLFNNGPCMDSKPFICRSDVEPPPFVPDLDNGRCADEDFDLNMNLCLNWNMMSQSVTFDQAVQYCKERGASLISIHDNRDFVTVSQGKSVWIGLVESIDEGFSWLDNTPVQITNWADGQPSWSGEGEAEKTCVVMHDDKTWSNVDCEDSYGFICTKKPVYEATRLTVPPGYVSTTGSTKDTPTPYPQKTPSTMTVIYTTHGAPESPTPPDQFHTDRPTTRRAVTYTTIPHTLPPVRTPATRPQANPTSVASKHSDSGGLSGGGIAGVVIAVLIIIAIIIGGVFILHRKGYINIVLPRIGIFRSSSFELMEPSQSQPTNFENTLYMETQSGQETKADEGESIAFVPLSSSYGAGSSPGATAIEGSTDDNSNV